MKHQCKLHRCFIDETWMNIVKVALQHERYMDAKKKKVTVKTEQHRKVKSQRYILRERERERERVKIEIERERGR